MPWINQDMCADCGICVDVCSADALEVNQHVVVKEDICIGCAACVSECLTAAIAIV